MDKNTYLCGQLSEDMKKYLLNLQVIAAEQIHQRYVLIRLTDSQPLPPMQPGQFVEVRVDGSPHTFLRRPISINFVDDVKNELWLLVATVGEGTRYLAQLKPGGHLNCMLPLGRGFTIDHSLLTIDHSPSGIDHSLLTIDHSPSGIDHSDAQPMVNGQWSMVNGQRLLVGGGVGVAPLLYLGKVLSDAGAPPTFLLGARTATDLLLLDEFRRYGRVEVTTEDGSMGQKGFVTNHSILSDEAFGMIHCCGPTPMMKAVAAYARQKGICCEVSLENLMACGLGACLCCVEKVRRHDADGQLHEHNVCVCKEGPVFNVEELRWHN